MRQCTKCGEAKPESEFYVRRGRPYAECKPCFRARQLERQARPEVKALRAAAARRYRASHPGFRHGLTPERYAALLESQGGVCADCRTATTLTVDHAHACCPGKYSCGKCVRALLCGPCNDKRGA
jgi:hypothetical protein